MIQKICNKCGKKLLNNDNKFCANCGSVIDNVKNKNKEEKNSFVSAKETNNVLLVAIFISAVIMTTLILVVKNYKPSQSQYLPPVITNPAYLLYPQDFLVDYDEKISNLPEDDKSVWVEEIIDQRTIQVSYIILKEGESIITFRDVKIAGLSDYLSGCSKEKAVGFLKKFIEHKYIYLKRVNNSGVLSSSDYIIRSAYILGEDIEPSLFADTASPETVDVAMTLIKNGYGISAYSDLFDFSAYQKMKSMQEVAEVAKKGFWGLCNKTN